MAVSGAVNAMSPRVDSTSGPPIRMKRNDGRKVKNVAMIAPKEPAMNIALAPRSCWVQAPTNPTKATTMISGPGVVSPSASPSII